MYTYRNSAGRHVAAAGNQQLSAHFLRLRRPNGNLLRLHPYCLDQRLSKRCDLPNCPAATTCRKTIADQAQQPNAAKLLARTDSLAFKRWLLSVELNLDFMSVSPQPTKREREKNFTYMKNVQPIAGERANLHHFASGLRRSAKRLLRRTC